MRRFGYVGAFVVAALIVIVLAHRPIRRSTPSSAGASISHPPRLPVAAGARIAALRERIGAEATSPIADELNSPNGSAERDVRIVNAVFEAWQTNFPGRGNPVGENDEITAALAGDNPLRFAFISPRSPAIDAGGRLCDRWGTPYRLHQIGGSTMEIWSAGPDRHFGTGDDVRLTPAGAERVVR